MFLTGEKRHVHFVGIGGAGLSALAFVLLARGWTVSGSDRESGPRLEALRAAGATVHVGHSASYVEGADALIVSSAIPDDNPEVQAAQARGITVYKRNRWLAKMTRGYELVAVAGTHGKTTTSAMLTLALADAGLDPTAVIGGEVPQLGSNARVGGSQYFVLEADEYDHAFIGLEPYIAVVTNVEHDHPDVFSDEGAVQRAFKQFVQQVRDDGLIVVCGDDPGARALVERLHEPHAPIITYGIDEGNTWQAAVIESNRSGGPDFVAVYQGDPIGSLSLQVPGRHNVLNALAVVAVATHLDVSMTDLQASLRQFAGAARRFEPVGSVGRIQIFDDYAHHPSEVRATLRAARQRFGGRPIWVVFQPHTYSRLATLLDDFATAFGDADRVYVSDVYAARETADYGVSGQDLARRIVGPPVQYVRALDEILKRLLVELPDDAVVMTLGAGDVTTLGPRLRRALLIGDNNGRRARSVG